MEIEYYEQLYRQLIEHFYQQFDYFITKEWGGIADQNEMNDAVRQKAYDTFTLRLRRPALPIVKRSVNGLGWADRLCRTGSRFLR